ncbi:MAG: sugar phosphate isomerase/epimerase [Chitinophagaceae bacterium]
MNRQQFLRLTGAGIVGSALLPENIFATMISAKSNLSVQLYTIRDVIALDLEGSVKRIADIGFKYVETAFWPEQISLEKAAAAIKKAGLKVSSCHIELPIGNKKDDFLKTAKAFDCKRLIWHGWPEDKRYSSIEGTKELIKVYNDAAAFAKSNGLEFGLHNHWWEYRNKVDGKSVHEWLLKETDPDIFFEIDTYWVKVAGYNPAEVIKKFGKRARYLHIKDGPAVWDEKKLLSDEPDPMTAVGKGTQNIPAIIDAAKDTEFFVVEMDKVKGDVFKSLKESYDYLHKKFKLS